MPTAPKKVNRPWVTKRKPFEMSTPTRKVYQSYKWRVFSKRYKENNPLCVKCEAKGLTTAAAVTDHIVRVADGGSVFDETNLQSLCESCHNSKSGKEAHGYKEK